MTRTFCTHYKTYLKLRPNCNAYFYFDAKLLIIIVEIGPVKSKSNSFQAAFFIPLQTKQVGR